MRYQSSYAGLGETVAVGALFPTGDTVTVAVYNMATQASVSLATNTTVEIGTTGLFVWLTSQLSAQPTTLTQYAVIFTNAAGTTAIQKIIKGGYPDQVAVTSFEGAVHIDTVSGTAGTAYPIGTPGTPVSNVADAKTIADAYGFKTYHIRGSITLAATHQNWRFFGQSAALNDTVNVGSQDVNQSTFENITVTGAIGGTGDKKITMLNCIADTVTGFNGVMQGGGIRTSIGLVGATRTAQFNSTKWLTTVVNGVLDANGIGNILASDMSGLFSVTNFTTSGVLFMRLESAELTLAASCTAGFYAVGGDGTLVNNSAMVELKNELLNKAVHTQLVQDGLDNQGYSTTRADNLDNLDAPISGVPTADETAKQVEKRVLPLAVL